MFKVLTLAQTTLREMLRERILMVVVILAVVLLALSLLLGALTLAEQRKILIDFGFLAIHIAVLGISIFYGSFMLAKEVEKQTCLLILSRPLSRDQFILGKTLGVIALNTLLLFCLAFILAVLLKIWNEPQSWLSFVKVCFALWFESLVLLCAVLCFSLIVRPAIAVVAGVMYYMLGHWLPDLTFFAEKSGQAIFVEIVKVFHWVTPNLYRLNWKSAYFIDNGIPYQNVMWMITHMSGWTLLLLLVTNFLFRRKDIV